MPRALLFNPPSGNYIRDDRCQVPADAISSSLRAPMDLLYCATILENRGYRCRLVDYPGAGRGLEEYLRDLREFAPDLVLASVTTPTLPEDMRCLEAAKRLRPGALTIAKGAHFIVRDDEAMARYPQLDVAVRNELEKAVDEIAAGLPRAEIAGITWRDGRSVRRNPDRPQIRDLDWLPLPNRRLLDNSLYVRPDTNEKQATIVTSRGCPKSCTFCLVKVVTGRPIGRRSPRSIAAEIESCVRDFNITNFYFRADTFTWYHEWVSEICDLILARGLRVNWVSNSRADTLTDELLAKMRAAGCWMLGLGIESGSEEILRRIKKGITKDDARRAAELCRRNGIKTYNFFILGFPWDDERTVAETVDFAIELNSDFVEFHTAYPFPGTELDETAKNLGLFEAADIHGSDVMTSPMRTLHLSSERVGELRRQAIRRYYLRPSYVSRTLSGIRSPRVLANYVRKGIALLRSLSH